MDFIHDRRSPAFGVGKVRGEVVDVDPWHVRTRAAGAFPVELEHVEQGIPDPELDPRVAMLPIGERVRPDREVARRLEPEDVGEPPGGRCRPRVVHAEREAGHIGLFVGYMVPPGAPGSEPPRYDAAPR